MTRAPNIVCASLSAVSVLSGVAFSAGAAELGRAPVASGPYATVEGGYAHRDGEATIGHGVVPTGGVPDPAIDTTISAASGWMVGVSIGYASTTPVMSGLPFTRIEGYLTHAAASDSSSDTPDAPGLTSLKSVDGSGLGVVGTTASSSQDVRVYDGGVRLSFDQSTGSGSSLTWVLAPFVRNSEEETQSVATGATDTAWRTADVSTWSYGAVAAIEPEVWLSPAVALVGRLGAGVYGYSADGDFASGSTASPDPIAAALSESDSGIGFRGQLGFGVKLRVAPTALITGFVEADYFSAVGAARLPDNQFTSATTSEIGIDDAWELRTGARLSIGLGGQP